MPEQGIFDIHCHIVPQVDDGASSQEETLGMLKMEYEQGVRNIIATPHYRIGMFETPDGTIYRQFQVLKKLAFKVAPDLKIYPGREFHVNMEMVEVLEQSPAYTMVGSTYVLAEFKRSAEISFIKERVHALRSHGFKPILAHIERYENLRKDPDSIYEISEMGALIQINADSVTGKEGLASKRFCGKLLDEELVSFIASDCHGVTKRPTHIGEAYGFVCKKYGKDYADEIFIENPKKILRDAVRCRKLKK